MRKLLTSVLFISALLSSTAIIHAEEPSKPSKAVSTSNLDISAENLNLIVGHMTSDELFVEADGWLVLLKDAAKKVNNQKLAINNQNAEISNIKALDSNKTTDQERELLKVKITKAKDEKSTALEVLSKLRAERRAMVSHLNTVLTNINEKIGTDENGKELEKVLPYRRYIDNVSTISLKMNDAKSAWSTLSTWITSEDGGIQVVINIIKFLVVLILAWFVSKLLSRAVRRVLKHTPSNSRLLNDFIADIIHNIVMLVGVLVALAALDVNVAPIMAMVGAAGFVVAFALQGTLSNFASGLMIMLYRPYDIGDIVDVAGIMGTVESMTFVSTSILTPDNRMMIVPNNSIWGNIITNVTHSATRRVDMTFGISYDDNIEQAQKVMEKILSEHPLVLKDPAPMIKVNELADSSVNFICRPWVKTADYWTVLWEVTRTVKERFDEEGISIPYPQSDIHLIGQNIQTDKSEKAHSKTNYSHKSSDTVDTKVMDENEDQ